MKQIQLEELTFDRIGVWPEPIKIMMVILSCFVICLLAYTCVLQQQFEDLHISQTENAHLKRVLLQQQQQIEKHGEYEKQLKNLQHQWQRKLQTNVNANQIPALLANINKAGIAHNLQFKSTRLLSEQTNDVFTRLPIEIIVEGEYSKFIPFLTHLAKLNPFVELTVFALKTEPMQKTLLLTLTLNIYRIDNKQDVTKKLISTSVANQNNPFQVDKNLAFALDSLRMVGYLQQDKSQSALLAAPNGYVYRVTVGSEVGRHHGKVLRVSESSIEIVEHVMGETKNLTLTLQKNPLLRRGGTGGDGVG